MNTHTTTDQQKEAERYFKKHQQRFVQWRHAIHAQPELAFEEVITAEFVAKQLKSYGLDVTIGLAQTGVVGVLKASQNSDRRIGLRADLDALPMTEEAQERPHCSRCTGKMHACGHDGHVIMLLAAAEYLSLFPPKYTDVIFIFQPAEENLAGGKVMVDEGLFEQFPVDYVFGLHNLPGLQFGHIAARVGAQMASADLFNFTLRGRGGHAAWPHLCDDLLLTASEIVIQCQGLVSRSIDPLQSAVVSVTQIHGGESDNVLPSSVTVRGTVRALNETVRAHVQDQMQRLVQAQAELKGLELTWQYECRYTATVNALEPTLYAHRCAQIVVGEAQVHRDPLPLMGAEDFGWMLKARPGCYVLLGSGDGPMLHHPRYDFNDDLISIGASYWVTLAYLDDQSCDERISSSIPNR